jgi:hypothetical protein
MVETTRRRLYFSAVPGESWTHASNPDSPPAAGISVKNGPSLSAALPLALPVVLGALWMASTWGFTIDDALITVRYAHNLGSGVGYRFNVSDAVTDGVTPIPFLLALLPFAHLETSASLLGARLFGAFCVLASATWFAARGRNWRETVQRALYGLMPLPICMHAVSGMETGAAIALGFATMTVFPSPRWTPILAGIAASIRPELLPWALVLAATTQANIARILRATGVCSLPFALVSMFRMLLFGTVSPLSLTAKPSDLGYGAQYAIAAAIYAVVPLLAVISVLRWNASPEPPSTRFVDSAGSRLRFAALAAGLVHLLAIGFAGGDWMPYARLLAPVLPTFAWILAASPPGARWRTALNTFGMFAMAFTHYRALPARTVLQDRVRMAHELAPFLGETIATVDAGWPTLVTRARILDLSGVTNRDIAFLPGGHTSKRIPESYLLQADTLLLYGPVTAFEDETFPRVVEARIARSERIRENFEPVHWAPLAGVNGYWVMRKRRL